MSSFREEIAATDATSLGCYLQGALRDGTRSLIHRTHRFGQADPSWLEVTRESLMTLGFRSWIYKEGKTRNFWVLETGAKFLDLRFDPRVLMGTSHARAFARGYFDADGGMPRSKAARLYVQFTQKDRKDLEDLKSLLEADGLVCGRIHNPSHRVDPDYWRFFVRSAAHRAFMSQVGSWHPIKRRLIEDRLGDLAA